MDTPIFVSLLNFVRTGGFGKVQFGIRRAELFALLGEPDGTAKANRRDSHPTIFLYGGWEFYVHADADALYGIRCDTGEHLRGGDTLVVDPWRLRFGLPIADAESALLAEGIAFEVRKAERETRLIIGGGAALFFATDPEYYDGTGLWAIECWRYDLLPHREPTKQVSITLTESEYEALRQRAITNRRSIGVQCAEWVREHLPPRTGE
ncbi:MAG: hypothetical protein H7Y38_10870 [Armatimonadetes bacterium]|nr:hypothetical protein [Armatimonadota bacterium]